MTGYSTDTWLVKTSGQSQSSDILKGGHYHIGISDHTTPSTRYPNVGPGYPYNGFPIPTVGDIMNPRRSALPDGTSSNNMIEAIGKAFSKAKATSINPINDEKLLLSVLYNRLMGLTKDKDLAKYLLFNSPWVYRLFEYDKYRYGVYVDKRIHVFSSEDTVVISTNKLKVVITSNGWCFKQMPTMDEITDKFIENNLIPILGYIRDMVVSAQTKNKSEGE